MSFPSGLICGDRRDDGRHDAGAELLCNDAGAEEAESHTPVWGAEEAESHILFWGAEEAESHILFWAEEEAESPPPEPEPPQRDGPV